MRSDIELLRSFAIDRVDADFSAVVAQRINFVYACALRQVGGDTHLAEEVTQSVFLDLARKAGALAQRPSLTGWLYTSTRFAARDALRRRSRRLNRETEAHVMQEITATNSRADIDWDELRPVIDEAMHELDDRDREAILQRYFEGRSFAEVGLVIGLTENSARMRVDRALEKLRTRLARRGITSTATALASVLASQPAIAAPAGLAATTASVALAGAGTSGAAVLGWQMTNLMSITAGKIGAACALACAIGVGVYQLNQARADARRELATASEKSLQQTHDLAALREENRRLTTALAGVHEQMQSDRPASATDAVANAGSQPLERLHVVTELQKMGRGIRTMVIPISGRGHLLNEFIALFELTPREQAKLQQAIDQAREQVQELATTNATVRREERDRVVIEIKPFGGGGPIYDKLMDTFAEALGSDRYGSFLVLAGGHLEAMIHQFGAEQRTITLTHNSAPESPNKAYTIVDRRRKADGGGGVSTSSLPDLSRFSENYGGLAKLLPPDF